MQPRVIIPLDPSDQSAEAAMIRRSYLGIRNKKTAAPKNVGTQTDMMMATGGIAQLEGQGPPPVEESAAPAGPPSGVIGDEMATPAEGVADDVPMKVPEGSFIINAAAAEVAGYKDIKKMIMNAIGVAKRLGVDISTGSDKIGEEEAVDLLVSKGEVFIEPVLAKIIGYDVLEKINNRGKREVARRQQEAEAEQQPQEEQAPPMPQMQSRGGFIKKNFADKKKINSAIKLKRSYDRSQNSQGFIPKK